MTEQPRTEYCSACQSKEHDVCAMVVGCPCCEATLKLWGGGTTATEGQRKAKQLAVEESERRFKAEATAARYAEALREIGHGPCECAENWENTDSHAQACPKRRARAALASQPAPVAPETQAPPTVADPLDAAAACATCGGSGFYGLPVSRRYPCFNCAPPPVASKETP